MYAKSRSARFWFCEVTRGLLFALAFALAFAFGVRTARAELSAPPVPAAVSASSKADSVSRAFDADGRSAWCPLPNDARGELKLEFHEPVRIKTLRVLVGRRGFHGSNAEYRPVSIQVTWQDKVLTFDPKENGAASLEVEGLGNEAGQTLSIRLEAPRAGHDDRCITELQLDLDGATWLFAPDDGAAAELPAAIAELTRAFRSCDVATLQRRSRFPVLQRELDAGSADSDLFAAAGSRARPYYAARDLARECNRLVSPDDPGWASPEPVRPLGPGRYRVWGSGGVTIYWDLEWKKQRWWLWRIAFIDFE